jgi:hypothetical protein
MDVCRRATISGGEPVKFSYVKVLIVIAVTALSVWFIPGVDDGVELLFQLVVLIASS